MSIEFVQLDKIHVFGTGSTCGTAVELMSGNPEVMGLIPARSWAFSINVAIECQIKYFLLSILLPVK